MKDDIVSLKLEDLEKYFSEIGEKKYRAKQVFGWLHKKLETDFYNMSNISANLKKTLDDDFHIVKGEILEKHISDKNGTIKYLFKLDDRNIIESVFMKHSYGNSVCVSTQAGCKMGCAFCASTVNGLSRNLTASEMLTQIYEITKDTNEKISNIVLMGSGEPLDNFSNVIDFIKIINHEEGLNIGERHITLSTCGLVDKMKELQDLKLQITLAISLHAPNDEIRRCIMPIAKRYKLNDLLKACRDYANTTKRRITFEYSLINEVNDSVDNARELSKILKGIMCHVNLIPVNVVSHDDFKSSSKKEVEDFYNILKSNGHEVTIRKSLGNDINASCGQLRNTKLNTL